MWWSRIIPAVFAVSGLTVIAMSGKLIRARRVLDRTRGVHPQELPPALRKIIVGYGLGLIAVGLVAAFAARASQ